MARKSRRELEQALDNLRRCSTERLSDLERGVTADFVTYEEETDTPADSDAADGWAWLESPGSGDVTYQVLAPAPAGGVGGGDSAE